MNMRDQHLLLRKISVIHAIKCNSTETFTAAIASFEKLNELKSRIINSGGISFENISKEIETWAETKPIASISEISKLMSINH
jgi:hypothetical protein